MPLFNSDLQIDIPSCTAPDTVSGQLHLKWSHQVERQQERAGKIRQKIVKKYARQWGGL